MCESEHALVWFTGNTSTHTHTHTRVRCKECVCTLHAEMSPPLLSLLQCRPASREMKTRVSWDQNRRESEAGAEFLPFYTSSLLECEAILNYCMNCIMVRESEKYHNSYNKACKPGGSSSLWSTDWSCDDGLFHGSLSQCESHTRQQTDGNERSPAHQQPDFTYLLLSDPTRVKVKVRKEISF